MSDEEIGMRMGLDVSDGISGLDDFASGLVRIEDAASRAGSGVSSGLDSAVSSIDDVSAAASDAAASLGELGGANLSGAAASADNLASSTSGAGAAAKEAHHGFTLLDGITLAAGMAAVEGMTATVKALIAEVDQSVQKFGELEAASTSAAMRTAGASSTEDYVRASQAVLDKSLSLAPQVGIDPTELTEILSTYQNTVGGIENVTAENIKQFDSLADVTGGSASSVYSAANLIRKQFGMDGFGNMTDVLAKTYGATGLNPEDVGRAGAMLSGDSMQRELGGFEGTMAALGKVSSKTGNSPTMVAMGLNSFYKQLEESSATIDDKGKKSFRGLGEELTKLGLDVQATKAKGMAGAIRDMRDAGADFTSIFDARSGANLLAYAEEQEGIQGLTEDLQNATGTLNEMGDAIEETLDEKMDNARVSMDTAKTLFGSLFEEPAKGAADFTNAVGKVVSEAITILKEGDYEGAIDYAFGAVYDYFGSLDYAQIGQGLHQWLRGGWDEAYRLFKKYLYSSVEIDGNILDDLFGPTFRDINSTLEIAGMETWISMGDGVVMLENAIGGGLTGAIRMVISALADMAGAADEALGGALSKVLGLSSSTPSLVAPASSDTQFSSYVEQNGNKYVVLDRDGNASIITTDYGAAMDRAQEIYGSGSTGVSAQWGMSGGAPNNYAALLADMYGGGNVHTSFWGEDKLMQLAVGLSGSTGHEVAAEEAAKIRETPVEQRTEVQKGIVAADDFSLEKGAMEFAIAKSGKVGYEVAAEEAAKIAEIPESQRTETQKGIVAADENRKALQGTISTVSNDLQEAGRADAKLSGNAIHDSIEKWGESLRWEDKPLFSEDPYWIQQLAELKAAREAITRMGGDNTDALKRVEDKIEETKTELANSIASAATGGPEIKTSSMYREDYVGSDPDAWAAQWDSDTARIAKTQAAVRARGGVSVGQQYAVTEDATAQKSEQHLQEITVATKETPTAVQTLQRTSHTDVYATATNIMTRTDAGAATVSGSVNAQGAAIVAAIQANGRGGGGGGFSGVGGEASGSSGGSGSGIKYISPGSISSTYDFLGSFAEGGYVDRPGYALIGDSPGGEFMIPAQKMTSLLNSMQAQVGVSFDASGIEQQIQGALQNISVQPLRVPVALEFDSQAARAVLTDILYDILAGVKI